MSLYAITVKMFWSLVLVVAVSACQHGGSFGVSGNENGSQPLNEQEAVQYKHAVLKCYKTGGTRVIKINGKLMCYN